MMEKAGNVICSPAFSIYLLVLYLCCIKRLLTSAVTTGIDTIVTSKPTHTAPPARATNGYPPVKLVANMNRPTAISVSGI